MSEDKDLIKVRYNKDINTFDVTINRMNIEALSDAMLEHLHTKIVPLIVSEVDRASTNRASTLFLKRMNSDV